MPPSRASALAVFRASFGSDASGVAFAPGRVNLIGEHIDYHGGPVLPAALQRGVTIAWSPREDTHIHARSVGPDGELRHPPATVDLAAIGDATPGGGWANYLKAAATMALREHRGGLNLLITSDLPEASGLSSSSALIVACGLAMLAASRQLEALTEVRRLELATQFAEAERYVGTAGGGMDQAASLGGQTGCALRIDFDPLRWRTVPFPEEMRLIVAHTGVRAEKSGAAKARYNEIRASQHQPKVSEHVRSEIERVEHFELALLAGDADTCGALMDASHTSLRDRLRVSHPALDALVDTAREAGAYGARMTGAGFGGSIVALADAVSARTILEALHRAQREMPGAQPAFIAQPGSGAQFW